MIKRFPLLFVISLSLFLRVWQLDVFPAGLNADEAAIGYNAYSLLKTGKDEYGITLPLAFKSFGDYKPGLYFYFVAPFVYLMGLNEWSVRLPSAILGTFTIYIVYLLAKKILENERAGLISALLLAINPWHLHFSRGGWETNAATFFIGLGIYLFLLGLDKSRYIFLSMLSFLISMYTYQSPRLVVPILLIVLIIFYRSQLQKRLQHFLKYIPILILLSVPLILQFTSGGGSARFSGLSFLGDVGPATRVNELRGEHTAPAGLITTLLHNKITAYAPEFLKHYLDHFNADFLFINGDPLIRNKVPETGQFFIIQALLLILGLVYLMRSDLKHKKIIFIWLAVAPLASSTTYQTPHALRALNMVIPLIMIISVGMNWIMMIGNKRVVAFSIFIIFLFTVFEFAHYLDAYYIHYPKRYPLSWEYGFKEMVQKLNKYEKGYHQIVITDRYDQPYILVLFYKQYDPKSFQSQAFLSERDKFNFGTVRSFDNYQFRRINKGEVSKSSETLYIISPEELDKDESVKIIDKVLFPNGETAFLFIQR